jgi:hypothetical protein
MDKKYKIISGHSSNLEGFSASVTEHLNDGWQIVGTPFAVDAAVHQAMIFSDMEKRTPSKMEFPV